MQLRLREEQGKQAKRTKTVWALKAILGSLQLCLQVAEQEGHKRWQWLESRIRRSSLCYGFCAPGSIYKKQKALVWWESLDTPNGLCGCITSIEPTFSRRVTQGIGHS